MVEAEVLRRRIDALLRYLDQLAPFTRLDRAAFVAAPREHDLAERYLHLAVECALDLTNHVIAEQGLEAPETYRAAFEILGRHGVIDAGLAQRLMRWAGMRNVLVHAYLDIDHGLVWDAITHDLSDLRELAARIATLL